MKKFKDMGIVPEQKGFIGDKKSVDWLLNRTIIVHDFKIEPSTKKPGTTYLQLQIEYEGQMYVTFPGSKSLQDIIQRVKKEDFPFETSISRIDNRQLVFT